MPAKLTELIFTSRLVFYATVMSSTAKLIAPAVKKSNSRPWNLAVSQSLKSRDLSEISAWLSGLL